ncbi:MAG: family 78 glycoside hydrolase catalytic domain [Firmicutes bacterium]|nr:family 78 glycoside hydrolase catalytic domain [Bacillota bacterium]
MKFREMFGAAQWVGVEGQQPESVLFRTEFAAEKPMRAELTIVGLGVFEAYINGKKVSEDLFMPLNTDYCPRSFQIRGNDFGEVTEHRLYCPKYDVTHLIETECMNVLAVMVGNGWFAHKEYPAFGVKQLCYQLVMTYSDGSERRIVSGPQVMTKAGFVIDEHMQKGETHDYRGYDDGWMLADYVPDGWQQAKVLPPLETDYLTSDCPADRVIRSIIPVELSETSQGRMYDCGENITGWPVLICRAAAGKEIVVRVGESLMVDGTLDPDNCHEQVMRYISDGTPRVLHPQFTWLAFQYFAVEGEADVVEVQVIHTDVKVTSSFRSNNSTLNWLYDAYIRTQLDNMHMGIPSDCPHIERRGYTGDGQLTCDAVMTMLDAKAFYKKWLGDIADCQDRLSGHVQYTAPYVQSGGGPGGWGCAIVEVPYMYYKHYNDAEPMAQMYPQMLHYFEYLDAHSENGLVVSDRPGEWCLGDWCTPEKIEIPEPFVNTYFYIMSLGRVLEIARVVGHFEDIPALEKKMNDLKAVLVEKYYDENTGDFCENIQGANAFAVDIGLGDVRTYDHIEQQYRRWGYYDTGIFGTDIVTRLLFENGDEGVAVHLLSGHVENGSYGYMQDMHATTLWEYWGDYARSYNHPMFGTPVRYLFQYVLGITQSTEGWEQVRIAPKLVPQLWSVSGHVTVPKGKISVAYERSQKSTIFRVQVPAGITAEFSCGGVHRQLSAGMNIIEI